MAENERDKAFYFAIMNPERSIPIPMLIGEHILPPKEQWEAEDDWDRKP
jgi:hypothetical protein